MVGDNDGSAFITKAEFDSLKNNFQSQIDAYNVAIDSKIDNAISSYLAGIKVEKKSKKSFFDGLGGNALVCDTAVIDNLKWGMIGFDIDITTCHVQDSRWAENAGAVSWFVMKLYRDGANIQPFEMFRYDNVSKKLISYSNDLKCTFKCTSIRIENQGWVPISTTPANFWWRWHAGTHDAAAKSNVYTDDVLVRGTYNTWLASPSWLHVYGRGFNSMIQGRTNRSGGDFGKWVYQPSVTINSETKILTIFDDSNNDKKNKLWTPCDDTKSTIYVKCLNSDYDSDTSKFAKNYDKTGRTLSWVRPDLANVKFKDGYGFMANLDQTLNISRDTIAFDFTRYGTMPDYSGTTITSADWYEPYFDNNEEYSKNIINASVNDTLLERFSPYGWYGRIPQGLPVDILEGNSECAFEITLPSQLVLGFKTVPFQIGTFVRNESADTNLKLYVDDEQKTTAAPVTLASGTHKIRIVYNGTDKKPLFFKVGRPSADASNKNRYIITLPKEYTLTKLS